MARPIRHVPRDTSRRRTGVYVGVVAFVAVDILLIVLALGSNRSAATAETAAPIATFGASSVQPTPAETTAPTPTPVATATSTSTPAASTLLPVPPTRLLGAVDAKTAWRAQTGACPTAAATPELTTDSGVTWKKTDATGPTKVTALQRLTVTSESTVEFVGLAKADCAPQFVKTFVTGDNYSSYPDKLAGTWYVDPADRATVQSPGGAKKAPCDAVVTLAVRDTKNAAALCADGRAFSTTDAAATWSASDTLPGTVTLTDTTTGYLAAAVGRSGCAGVQILTLKPSLESAVSGCYPTPSPAQSLPGNVALSGASGTLWLWAGDALGRSSDGGATWK
ncbi:hypothetical protein [Cryobacterium sp. 5B3]|uniref:hypothetical protein n=1 Tax=Cryobacterium sp. 5B3 TaxID=3048586 RepID=UPI002AB51E36|nr:hypothetical protein [Cryobacterium sp. 5B3]MDY7540921.1 hypothetical protein [Cryobacterium sp. 5B3]MEB0276144.1 hypothetical protein [Cryobacterium sp. 5B3]